MAAGFTARLSDGTVEVRSGGSEPGDLNPVAVAGDGRGRHRHLRAVPQLMTTEQVHASDAVVTMGCGDVCPIFPGKRYEDWELADPAGQGIDAVRPIRDDIRVRVERLLAELRS